MALCVRLVDGRTTFGHDHDGGLCRNTIQNVGNILGALYLSMLFLGIINSRTIQPVAAAERAVCAL